MKKLLTALALTTALITEAFTHLSRCIDRSKNHKLQGGNSENTGPGRNI